MWPGRQYRWTVHHPERVRQELRHRHVDRRAPAPWDLVYRGRDQLPRHDLPSSRAGIRSTISPYSSGPSWSRKGSSCSQPGPRGRPVHPAARPPRMTAFLSPIVGGDRSFGSTVLVLLASGRVHHDPPGDGDHLGSHSTDVAQTDLRVQAIALSTVAIGFLSFGVWVHHMFTTDCRSPRDSRS